MSTYKYKSLREPTNIRLLALHSGKRNDAIKITLHESDFHKDDPQLYEALSYVWGSKDDPKCIKVDNQGTLLVTENLFIALCHLRLEDAPRILWIDALSIDQSNNEEKGMQVGMMGKNFRFAFRVIAWLGPEANESGRAMEILGHIGSQIIVDWNSLIITAAPDCAQPSLVNKTAAVDLDSEDVAAIHHLISRQWYERLWVRQEIFLANSQAVVRCGSQTLLWTTFRRALFWLLWKVSQLS
jgi:hypothetical protein